jgi:hypothetical protein
MFLRKFLIGFYLFLLFILKMQIECLLCFFWRRSKYKLRVVIAKEQTNVILIKLIIILTVRVE